MTGPERTRMWDLLRQGLGVEDVAVKMRQDPDLIRRLVNYQRQHNQLHTLLGTDRARNEAALRIMGVSRAS